MDGEVVERGLFKGGGEGLEGGELLLGREGGFAAGFDFTAADEAGAGEGVFGRIAEREDDEVVAVAEELEGGKGVGIVEIREDEDEGAFA